jgi:hypothetical protein
MPQGMVVEEGSHNELILRGGLYYNLVRRQLQGGGSSRNSLRALCPSASTSYQDIMAAANGVTSVPE